MSVHNLTCLQINWMTSYWHRVERPVDNFFMMWLICFIPSVSHTIGVSYLFGFVRSVPPARGPRDNMIGLLRLRRFATAGKALLLACYGQFKLTVASQSSRSFSQLASWLLQVTGSSCTERAQIISKYTFRIFNSAFQISITQTSFTLNWNSLTTPY